MKTKEELNALKEEVETLSSKLAELSEEELKQVTGGVIDGAARNRLDYTSNNLSTASENVQSEESSYRDTDMEKEMAEFTKNNILMQAAQSMLAQANQQNQGVITLLQ